MSHSPTRYWEYLRLPELLELQHGLSEEEELSNDEVLFITVHQIDELWFKLILRELVVVRDLFARPHVPEQDLGRATRGLQRIARLFEQVGRHFALMETMTTRDYLAFRDKLSPASGFQSVQMREMEVLMGLEGSRRVAFGHAGSYRDALKGPKGGPSWSTERLERRLGSVPTLKDAVDEWLHRTPIMGKKPGDEGADEALARFQAGYLAQHASECDRTASFSMHDGLHADDRTRIEERYAREKVNAAAFLRAEDVDEGPERARRARIRAALLFIESYRELPLLAWPREVVDAVVALEQASLIFRQRHARMVERVIGRRTGTGGSAGVDYLDKTALRYRVFDDFWTVRSLLLREEALPPLEDASFYGLVADRGAG
ncbi:MAG: tryptophan 2,3-dioxygenase family protein [Myxococcota bacterium]